MTIEQKLLRATYFLGLIPLTIGLLIFFSWWIGKVHFLVTLHTLEEYGFTWILISLPLGFLGLLTAGAYIIKTYKTNLKKGIIGLFCILVNLPALFWVLTTQADIEQRAYTRIYNHTGKNFEEVSITNSKATVKIGPLSNGKFKTPYFYPYYLNSDFSSPLIDTVNLIVQTAQSKKTITLPAIYQNECVKVFIDHNYEVTLER